MALRLFPINKFTCGEVILGVNVYCYSFLASCRRALVSSKRKSSRKVYTLHLEREALLSSSGSEFTWKVCKCTEQTIVPLLGVYVL